MVYHFDFPRPGIPDAFLNHHQLVGTTRIRRSLRLLVEIFRGDEPRRELVIRSFYRRLNIGVFIASAGDRHSSIHVLVAILALGQHLG